VAKSLGLSLAIVAMELLRVRSGLMRDCFSCFSAARINRTVFTSSPASHDFVTMSTSSDGLTTANNTIIKNSIKIDSLYASMAVNWDEPRGCTPDFDGILLERFEDGNEDCDDCCETLIGLENKPPEDDCCPPLTPLDVAALDCEKSFAFLAGGGIPVAWFCARTTLGFGGGAAGEDLSSPSDETTNF